MTPLRVCMLTTGFPRFSGDLFGVFIFELARALVARGSEVEVVAPHQRGVPTRERMEGIEVSRFYYFWPAFLQRVAYGGGIPTNVRRSWWARLQVPFFLLGYGWQARCVGEKADLVHCHWTISGLVAAWFLGRDKALVLSVRGSDINLLDKGWMRGLNRYITARMNVVIAVSEDIAAKLEQGGVAREKISVVYNGVDARFCPGKQREQRDQLQLPVAHFVMLFVGLLVPVKGLQVLIEALSRWDEGPWLCVLVGDGPLLEELRTAAERAGIAEHLLFAGRRPSQEVSAWMQAADVLVLPSYSEGRPNVVLEAQACGIPVVATRVGGTTELVVEGETALLVDSGDVEGLGLALATLRDDAALCKEMGRRARAHVEASGLTWDHSAAQMEAIYRRVLEAV